MKKIDAKHDATLQGDVGTMPMFYIDSSTLAGLRPARSSVQAIRPGKEVRPLKTKSTRFKQGIVSGTLHYSPKQDDAYWLLRYTDPSTGRDVKRRVAGDDRDKAKEVAEFLTKQAYRDKGYLAQKLPTIEEGMLEAIRLANTQEFVMRERIRHAKRFLVWLAERYQAVKTWDQMRPVVVQSYIVEMERAGLAYDTVRLAVAPVKLGWRHVAENWPDSTRPLPRIRQSPPPRREIECLEAEEVALVLDWLKEHAKDLWPIACVQALCGLRMLEAAALRIQDVDIESGLLTVTDTGKHKPKTRDSFRTVPVCGEALRALRAATAERAARKVQDLSGELFVNRDGRHWTKYALSSRWTTTLRHMAACEKVIERSNGRKLTVNRHGLGIPRLSQIPARKLRAAFATMASRLGAQDRLLKTYLGHSAGDMLGSHYRRISADELRSVSELMDGWRGLADRANRNKSGNAPAKVVVNS